jgi:hypothetical protein
MIRLRSSGGIPNSSNALFQGAGVAVHSGAATDASSPAPCRATRSESGVIDAAEVLPRGAKDEGGDNHSLLRRHQRSLLGRQTVKWASAKVGALRTASRLFA